MGENFKLESHENAEMAARAAGARLNEIIQSSEGDTLLLLSGGSAMNIYQHLNIEFPKYHVTVSMLDERYDVDPKINNCAQFLATPFGMSAQARGIPYIDTRVQRGETFSAFTSRYDSALRTWRERSPQGKMVAILGMGADGHTAGVLPHAEDPEQFARMFLDPLRWVLGYDAGSKNQYPLRLTTTLTFLRDAVEEAVAYIVGESKREALTRVVVDPGSLAETPARIMKEMRSVVVFTDQIIET